MQAGLDHLQRAAREMIAASARPLPHVAEELVEDPRAAAGIVDLLGSVANRRGRPAPAAPHDDDGEPPVQRIPVS